MLLRKYADNMLTDADNMNRMLCHALVNNSEAPKSWRIINYLVIVKRIIEEIFTNSKTNDSGIAFKVLIKIDRNRCVCNTGFEIVENYQLSNREYCFSFIMIPSRRVTQRSVVEYGRHHACSTEEIVLSIF